jgi:iron(III) transport system permease protein
MGVGETATEAARDDEDEDGARPLGLTLASGAVAALVVTPLTWVVLAAIDVPPGEAYELLTRETTVDVFVNSAVMVSAVTVLCVAVGVPLAWLTVRTDLPFSRFWSVAVTLPLVIPSYLGAFAFISAFGPRGRLQDALAPYGVERIPSIYGLEGTIFILTLYTYPYVFITTRASLKRLDTQLVDAARTLRHDRWAAFRRVVVPQIRPAVAAGTLLASLYALADYGTPALMRYQVFTNVIFTEQRYNPDLAALLSLQLVGVTAFILAVEYRTRGSERLYTRQGGYRGDAVSLGRWRWPATLVPAVVATLALAVPIGILLLWLVDGGTASRAGVAFDPIYALHSVEMAFWAALAAGLLGLPVAYLSARHRGRLSGLLERATYVGYAIPGVVVGLALVFFSTRTGSVLPAGVELYHTLPLLIFAYVVRFIPQSVGSTRASFLQVDPKLPEAARTLGRTSLGAFRSVTFPLVAPGLLAGVALVFLTTMKELPVTLMLRPSGYETLVTFIWAARKNYAYGEAALPALLLVGISALSIGLILRGEGYDVE